MTTVHLRLFEDDATGEYGFAHSNAIDSYNGISFDSFYTPIGMLHDIFEHHHEGSKYFQGSSFLNIGGEIAAIGAATYIYERIGSRRMLNPNYIYPFEYALRKTITDMIQESIEGDYSPFGDTLECSVPKQKPVRDSYYLEDIIDESWSEIKSFDWRKSEKPEYSKQYKESCTRKKIADLYRYGYRQASLKIKGNSELLLSFIDFWEKFVKVIDAKTLWNYGVTSMTIKWNSKKWTGSFKRGYDTIKFNCNSSIYNLEEKLMYYEY